ncbi:hypothetical protein [Paenibacillus ginsengihumi]|uniref:hypothetical protein n=1 Tax=Paenibacillus ginsengihumi TaxID=431596 RepID=UPI000367631F|nr:hypothetical protein [Paenibacillus ginsengihumi]
MKETQIRTFLTCIRCKDETEHTITYLNEQISRVCCNACGKQLDFNIDISYEIYDEVLKRIRTKPTRMTEEYRNHLKQFLLSLPARILSKPYRVYRESKEIKGYFQKYNIRKK